MFWLGFLTGLLVAVPLGASATLTVVRDLWKQKRLAVD